MRNLLFSTALLLAAAPAFAADLTLGTQLGATNEAIKAALTEMGWEVRKFDTDDGMIEVYAVMGTRMIEIEVDPATGAVVKLEDED